MKGLFSSDPCKMQLLENEKGRGYQERLPNAKIVFRSGEYYACADDRAPSLNDGHRPRVLSS